MQYIKTVDGWKTKAEVSKPQMVLPITARKGVAKVKGQAATPKASIASTPKTSMPAEKGSTSSPLLSSIQELQRQVAVQDEDIRVLQRLVMDAIRSIESLEKLLKDNLEVPPTE